jgi:hypothetical protein
MFQNGEMKMAAGPARSPLGAAGTPGAAGPRLSGGDPGAQ